MRLQVFSRTSFQIWVSLIVAATALSNGCLNAQVPASPQLPPASERELAPPSQTVPPLPQPRPALPPPEELLPAPTLPPPQIPSEVPSSSDRITVERFEVIGSTVFSSEEFDKVTTPFTKRPISLAELFQVRTAITQLYLEKGYFTSGAFIPPQKLQSGVVQIQVVEGRLEEIEVTGTTNLDSGYVRSRLGIAAGPPLNRERLLTALQLLQLNPLIQSISAELTAGTRPGSNILQVQVSEAKAFGLQVALDNNRSPSVGSERRQLQISTANLTGLGDSLALSGTNTDGSNALDVSYTVPLSPYNTTLSFSYGTSSSQVLERPFNILDITSGSRYYEVTLRQPLIQTPSQELAVGLTGSRRESEARLLGGLIPFPTLGADDEGNTRISVLRFFQEFTQRSSQDVFALRSQFSLGLDVLGTTAFASAPDSRFLAWRGQAQYVRLLAPDTLLLLRTDLQLADQPLVALEQFGLGGAQSVRGYRQDLLLADDGLFASAEVRIPVLRIPEISGLMQIAPFIDFGAAWNQGVRPNPDPSILASVGLGLRLQIADQLTARFDWGIPLVSISQRGSTLQENGLYYSIVYDARF